MPSINDLRQMYPGYAGLRDEEIINDMAEANGVDAGVMASHLGWERPTFGKEAVRAVKRTAGSMVSGVGEIGNDLGLKDNALMRYGHEVEQANPSGINSLADIADYPAAALGNALGNAATMIVPGAGLQLTGKAFQAAKYANAARMVSNPVTQAAVAGLPSLGSIGDAQRESGEGENLALKYSASGLVGAIENLGGVQRLMGFGGQKGARTIAEQAAEFGATPWRTFGKQLGRSTLEEGGEEILQNPIEQYASYKNPMTAESLGDTAFSGAMGALGGGIGGYHAARAGMKHSAIRRDIATDLLNTDQPLTRQANLAQWESAFKDKAGEDGSSWYSQFMDEQNNARLQNTTTWNEPLDAYRQRLNETASPTMGAGPSSDFLNEQLGIGQKPVKQNYAAAYNAPLETPMVVEAPDGSAFTLRTAGQLYDYQNGNLFQNQRDALGTPLNTQLPPTYAPIQNAAPQAPQGTPEGYEIAGFSMGVPYYRPIEGAQNVPTQVAQAGSAGASGVASGSTGNLANQPGLGVGGSQPAGTSVVGSGANPLVGSAGTGVSNVKQAKKGRTLADYISAVDSIYQPGSQEHADLVSQMQQSKSANKALKLLATSSKEGFLVAYRFASPNEREVLRIAMGLDEQGNQVAPVIPKYADIAKALGKKDRQYAQNILAKYGINAQVLNQMHAAQQDTVNIAELMPSQQGEDGVNEGGTGFRVTKNPNGSDDIVDDRRTRVETQQANKWATEQGIKPNQLAQVNEDETVQTAEEIERTDRVAEAARINADIVFDELLAHPEAKNAATDWEDTRKASSPSWEELTRGEQAELIADYAEAVREGDWDTIEAAIQRFENTLESQRDQKPESTARIAGPADTAQTERSISSQRGEVQRLEEGKPLPNEAAGRGDSETESQTEVALTPQSIAAAWNEGVAGSPLPTFPGLEEDERQWLLGATSAEELQNRAQEVVDQRLQGLDDTEQRPEGKAQFSEGRKGGVSADSLRATLAKYFFSGDKFNKLVSIYGGVSEIPENVKAAAAADAHMSVSDVPWSRVQGFTVGGKVYLIAGNIKQGNELSVFLHELGVHIGMEKLLGVENFKRLSAQVAKWAQRSDNSLETRLAKEAVRRAGESSSADREQELVAYFVEEAVEAGVNPTALQKESAGLQQWFRSLWAAAKLALRKIGFGRFDSLTAQNIVDLSYGAARLEIEGTWHGTAADFRNFNHEYMGSGEGAQAFGWGTYLAQRPGIAKGYWEADVRRKQVRTEKPLQWKNESPTKDVTVFRATDHQGRDISVVGVGNTWSVVDANVGVLGNFSSEAEAKNYAEFAGYEQPDGSLMRVDTAVHDDEMLDWDKPLSEQNKVRVALMPLRKFLANAVDELTGGANWNEMTGEEVYRLVQRALEQDYFDPNISSVDDALRQGKTDQAASEYLDSIGIKGIKFLDSQSRDAALLAANAKKHLSRLEDSYTNAKEIYAADPSDGNKRELDRVKSLVEKARAQAEFVPTRNLVIFNDKNIQRVATQVGADRNRVKFSESKTLDRIEQYGGSSARSAVETAGDLSKRAFKWFMSLHDLINESKGILKSAQPWYDSVRATIAARNRMEQKAEAIAARVAKLPSRAIVDALNEFVASSTYEQKWGYDVTLTRADGSKVQIKADPAMAQKFDKLKSLSPEAANIAKEIFAHGEEMKLRKLEVLKSAKVDPLVFKTGTLQGPYAPLKRFGNEVAVLKSQDLLNAEKAKDAKLVEKLKADPKHYIVAFFDARGEASAFARAKAKDYAFQDVFTKNENLDVGHQMNTETLSKIRAALKLEGIDPKAKRQFERMIEEMYLKAYDEHSHRMSGLQRKNYEGYDKDMVRSFLAHARAEAAFIANMEHGGKTNELYYKLQNEVKDESGKRVGQEWFRAITKHYIANLDHTETPIQDRVLTLTSVMQLATNPAYHLQNLLQPTMVTVPRLAADFKNYGAAWDALRQGYAIVREAVSGGLFSVNIDPTKVKNQKLRDMLVKVQEAGLLDVGMDEDTTQFEQTRTGVKLADNGTKLFKTAVHKMRQVSRRVEATNRISAAVAAFNMHYAKNRNEAAATEYAISVLQDTQGDFSKTDAPLIIKKLPKIVVQYRKFQLMMAAHYVKAFRDAFRSEDPETRAVGRRILAYSLGHAFLASGAMGLPLMNLAALAFAATGDDDEPRDLERSLRNLIGDETAANLLLRSPLYLFGLDAKLAQDKVFSILPYADWDLTSKQGVTNLAVGAMGPSMSNAAKMAEGLGNMAKGEYTKGLIGLLPSGLSNAVKAFDLANEGYRLKGGDVMVKPEDISTFQMLTDALGLKSVDTRRLDWIKNQHWEIDQFYSERTKAIQRGYAEAVKEGDTEAMAEAREDWAALQDGKDRLRYLYNDSLTELKRQPLSNLLKYPQNKAKREEKLQRSIPQ